jgi:peptidoglycan/LPS O-acetylase OafA/YrhL
MIWNFLLHIGIFLVTFFIAFGLVKLFRPGSFVIAAFLSILILSVCAVLYYFIGDSSFKMKLILLLTIVAAIILGVYIGKKGKKILKKKNMAPDGQVQ